MSYPQSTTRLFIAIDINNSIRNNIGTIIAKLASSTPPALNWIPVHKIHLTLKFLGDTPDNKIKEIESALNSVCLEFNPFKLVVGGLGAFPKLDRPRIIWIGLKTSPELMVFQNRIDKSLLKLGFASENRPFNAHLTLCRVPDHFHLDQIDAISRVLKTTEIVEFGSFNVSSANLYRSDLTSGGAIYTCLYSTDLGPLQG
jgi:2'-5' RNA ligase